MFHRAGLAFVLTAGVLAAACTAGSDEESLEPTPVGSVGPDSGPIQRIEIRPVPEGPSETFETKGRTTTAGTTWSIDSVRRYVPSSLPDPLAQPEGCNMGGSLIMTFSDGATVVYGPCVRPASIDRLWAAMEFVVTHGGCLEDCGPGGEPAPQLEGGSLPPEALPLPEPSPWAIAPSDARDHPASRDVEVGESRPYHLNTHCGIDFRVDFDGSFWQSYVGDGRNPIGDLLDPMQPGTMTLLREEVAMFQSSDGDATIYFVRNDSPKPLGACF